MFENLRSAFREAVENFKEELNRDQVPRAVDELLRGMRDEVTEAKTRLHDLEQGRDRALAEARREAREADTCRRRARMAREIGDEETAAVADDFLEKHLRRQEVLEGKARALGEELLVRKAEIEEMIGAIKEARARRDALSSTAGRESARESIRGTRDLFEELDRMAEKIKDDDARREAADDILRDLDRDVGEHGIDLDDAPPPPPDLDSRLAELKRRMDEE